MDTGATGVPAMDEQAIRTAVRERYARAATLGTSCCGSDTSSAPQTRAGTSCCAGQPISFLNGRAVPEALAGASLGCGAPIDAAALQSGETVVDLGSGAGLDAFFAGDRVGPDGCAIGVDIWTADVLCRRYRICGKDSRSIF